jgi:hypothetical protein
MLYAQALRLPGILKIRLFVHPINPALKIIAEYCNDKPAGSLENTEASCRNPLNLMPCQAQWIWL